MYKLKYFTEEDSGEIISFIKENPFAFVSGNGNEYPVATQLPLDLIINDDKIFLTDI